MPTRSRMMGAISLRVKVPLFIGAGLLVIIATWTWISYNNVRDAMVETGEQRLNSVTTQFAEMYQTQLRTMGGRTRLAITRGPIPGYVRGSVSRDSAFGFMRRLLTGQTRHVQLFALDGTPLLSVPDTLTAQVGERHEELAETFAAVLRDTGYSAAAPLRMMNDSVALPIVTAVLQDSQPVAFLVAWLGQTSTPQGRQMLSRIVGADARPYLGNARGDLWVDFSGQQVSFPADFTEDDRAMRMTRDDGTAALVAAKSIPGTPWKVAISFADSAVMAPAATFLSRSIVLGTIVLIISTLAAWLLSLRITSPLFRLTEAATAAARDGTLRSVISDRGDEIGQLSDSFNRMAAHVNDARHALEAKVQARTGELQERNEELEAFAHSVSHDLRAPLRAMHGFSQALLEDCADTLSPAGTDYVKRIAVASQRMDLLTQDLLAYSRVSRTEMPLAPTDLDGVVSGAVGQLEADVTERGGRVIVGAPLPKVLAHRAVLEQVFANLVSNGLKFVAPGRAPEIEIGAEPSNGRVRVWVKDNGIGIEAQHHQRIFSVFERLHAAEQYAGTGIGLAIVRKGVERMGGRVGVVSAPNAGSTFWIELKSAEA